MQPEWFLDAADILHPLLDAKHAALNKVLQADTTANRKAFRRQQRVVKSAVDRAKEEWMRKVTSDAEKAKKDGKLRWRCIRQLQMTHIGRRPRRPTALMREDGQLTGGPQEVKQRWHDHFMKILNIPSCYCQEVIDEMPVHPVCSELDSPPTLDELLLALSRRKVGKAGGKTGILPELLK